MQIFELSISRGAGSKLYGVQVVNSPAGEASAEFTLDVDALLAQRGPIQTALLASSANVRGRISRLEQPVRDLGAALFEALFATPAVAGRYQASLAIAHNGGEPLRVILRIDPAELAALPWEAMYDAGAGGYVCHREPLVRRVPVAATLNPLQVTAPLRIMGIVSAPRGLPPLDAEREREQLATALRRPISSGAVELVWAPDATWETLQEMLLTEQWHIIHFIGHGDFDAHDSAGVLALTGDGGRVNRVTAGRFADLLGQAEPMPRVVVLNSCSSATSGADDLFSGTAAALARGGIRAVAAMQFSVTDRAAVAFSRAFYTALAAGRGVDQAVLSGRIGVLGTGGSTLEWLTPVLYLRGDDAHLFTVLPPTQTATNEESVDRDPSHSAASAASAASAPSAGTWRELRRFSGAAAGWWGSNFTIGSGQVVFSPDGSILATGSTDRVVRLWDPTTGQELAALSGHTKPVRSLAFSPGGELLASGSADKTIRLWNPTSGQAVRTPLIGHTDWVQSVAFSPDGAVLASGSADQTVRLWDPATGQPVGEPIKGHRNWVRTVAFGVDNEILASAGNDGTIRLWNISTGELIGEPLTGHTRMVRALAFSPDGAVLASSSADKTIRLWDPHTGQPVGEPLSGNAGELWSVTFSPDGRLLASGGNDGSVQLWNVSTGRPAGEPLTGHLYLVGSLAFSPDGRLLASSSPDRIIRIWGPA
ncbi:CHAT domain-containing WD40 repeat protein [Paractinoplanes bogorensis]|uniref:CHAT domain-containing WD40 repeat protein n=1 Tax=Paractinoplanes bogorensis TaxID=1610840 RepID=UPI001C041DCD|nr:CHAT domain-containing protein [Actinoplanes bogorensis]